MKKLDIFYVEGGGGHKSSALALKAMIELEQRPWAARPVYLAEVLKEIDFIRNLTGRTLDDYYNSLLKRGWTWLVPPLVPLFHLFIRLNRRKIVDILVEHWRRDPPDMVVCMIPHFIKPMWQALQQVDPDIPFVTIMTDMANLPGFWFADVPHHLLCGSEKSYRQALAAYGPSDRVRQVNGMILRPEFYSGRTVDVAAYRESIGLCPVTTTGLIMFGAQGSSDTLELIEELERSDIELQLIVLCGHNQKLLDKLNRRGSSRVKVVARAFTDEIATLMQAADFMVGKPGPASISEAVASNLPPVVLANRGMLPQERYNAVWLEEQELGVACRSWKKIGPAVRDAIDIKREPSFQTKCETVRNRAAPEIVAILDSLLAGQAASVPAE